MTKNLLEKLMLFVLTLGFAVSMNAQVTTSGLSGTISDKLTKETLIGATVVAKHLPTGTTYGAITNEKGNYVLNGLRPGGPYTLEVSYIGYDKKVFKNITLSLGSTEYINVVLGEDTKKLESVVVVGDKHSGFNARRTGAATNFGRKAIENAPTVSRSLFDIAKLTPQANVTGNGISFAGANNRYNSFQIDGAVSNDTFGLADTGTNGGQTGANPISIEAIDALQIVIAPFDVRQGGFTGGGINAVTKGGTNTFKGSAYNYFQNQDFYGKTPGVGVENRRKLDNQMKNTVGFTLGGPIVKDKLFFFVNGEYEKNTRPSTFNLGDENQKVTQAEADAFLAKYKALNDGYDGGGFGKKDINSENLKTLVRLDWNISRAHKLSLRYSYLQAKKDVFGNAPTKLTMLNSGYVMNNRTHSVVGELNSRLSNRLNNELRVGYNRIRDFRETPGNGIYPFVSAGYQSNTIIAGTDRHSINNRLDQDIITVTDNLSLNLGNHNIVLGTHNEIYSFYNVFLKDLYGAYNYSKIGDFVKGGKFYEFTRSQVNKDVVNADVWGPRFRAMQLGFYLQDEWKVTEKLRLTYGLRMDLPLFLDMPTANDTFNNSDIAAQWGVNNSRLPNAQPLWSPRLGFRYDLTGEKKYILRGGAGVFTGRVPFVWISNNFVHTGVQLTSTKISGKNDLKKDGSDPWSSRLNNVPMKQDEMFQNPSKKSEVNVVARNFKFPQVARFNLAYEATLPYNVKATVEGMFTKNLNNAIYRNINTKLKGENIEVIGADKAEHCIVTVPAWESGVDKNFTDVILLDNTDRGYSYNITGSLSKEFDFGLSASVAYTFGRAMSQMDNGSSVASSNWKYAPVHVSTYDDELAISNFDVRHRIVANLTYSRDYGKYFGTTISLLYNGQSGERFSLMWGDEVNGDGEKNDLMYLPTVEEAKKLKFYNKKGREAADADRQAFIDLIESNPEFKAAQGTYTKRNGFTAPFLNKFDLHFAQNFYFNVGKTRQTLQLNADIVNLGNFFNYGWGLSQNVKYNKVNLLGYNTQYKSFSYKNDPVWYANDFYSRWHAQIGVKYIF